MFSFQCVFSTCAYVALYQPMCCTCVTGCIGGGGQPKSNDPMAVFKRMQAIYTIDERSKLRKSHENPQVKQLYSEFLTKPLGHLSHHLLHTTYTDRSGNCVGSYKHAIDGPKLTDMQEIALSNAAKQSTSPSPSTKPK